mmetsp:Transcript_32881/g.33495  ORF Transcript_32881/g.33495 Transcript_32881/m.33495 type:complete len:202 (+) Transcript_32881:82-687(+)
MISQRFRMASSSRLPISAVVAITPEYGIGKNCTLPWKAAGVSLSEDMKYFKQMTTQTINKEKINAVLMGRRTYEGIPERFRPLKNRINIVLSRNLSYARQLPDDVITTDSFVKALSLASENDNIERVVVIGGASLFEESILNPNCDCYHVTHVGVDFPSDTSLTPPTISKLQRMTPVTVSDTFQENGINFSMAVYDPRQNP